MTSWAGPIVKAYDFTYWALFAQECLKALDFALENFATGGSRF